MHFDSEELIQKSIQHIDEKLFVAKLQYTVTTGTQGEDWSADTVKSGNGFVAEKSHTFNLDRGETSQVKYDLIGKIGAGSHLPRRTVTAIMNGISPLKFAMYVNNPEEFISKVSRLINEEKATMIVDDITAKRKIAKYIELHDTNIAQKVEIIIEHFKNNIMKELGGKAKAMVVTSSRQAAVKYRNEFVDYIARHGYTGIHALVAFSGKVTLDGKEYTEEVMNGISEEDLPEVFGTDSYQVLLVANKYQTGFDQPKLCAMYVDKRLRGVAAVQTLSRLNRICAPYNKKTFVLDFKNTYEDIQNAFAPYYTETVLNETITPSDIRAVEAQVDQYGFLDLDDIDTFNEYLYQDKRTAKDKAKMWSLLDKSLQIINKFPVLEKMEIRATIKRLSGSTAS